ncbi:MAG: hypothetical protein U0270_01845 [Labilithrix sp.]
MPHLTRAFLLALLVACNSEAEIGESCEEPGKTEDVCVDGAVCTKNRSGALQCLAICTEQSQCGAGSTCNGVEGSGLKACRTEK